MAIAFKCRCGETLSAPDSMAGRDMMCPHCADVATVPIPVPPLVPGVIRIEKSEVDQVPAAPRPAAPKSEETYELDDGTEKSAAMKASRRLAGKICPICQDEIKFGEEIVICEYCRLPFHDACWKENGGCGTYGCLGASTVKQARTYADITVLPDAVGQPRPRAERPAPFESGARRPFPVFAVRNVSIWAVVSLLAGIIGIAAPRYSAFLGLFAVIIGIFAILDIRKNPALRGRIMAVAGMAIGFFDFICGTVR